MSLTKINFISFGFKYGIPNVAHLMIDMRFLANPYFVPELKKNQDGESQAVRDFVLSNKVRTDTGVIILTDMFGGTPSNLSYSFLEEGQVEVISGVNLPILLKAISSRNKLDMGQLTDSLVEHGKKSISLACGILKGTKRA